MIDPAAVLAYLNNPLNFLRLDELPTTCGLYALADHQGRIRYIGMTETSGLRNRIYNRHTTGSEGRSHKFSHAYNLGRMWRSRRCAEQDPRDAEIAKDLRTRFIRRYCRAAVVPLALDKLALLALETRVLTLAPADVKAWNDDRWVGETEEPSAMVETLLDELGWPPALRASLDRQAALFERYGCR
jgi:hypothetical protein